MKRLVKVDIGGIPYANTDFTEILQNEHIKCYGGLLDSMNFNSYEGRNSGIILKGCRIISASNTDFTIDFFDSMIYLDGEFYQYINTSTIPINIPYDTFYLYVAATSSETRYLRDQLTPVNAVQSSFFGWTSSEPPTGDYIKFSNKGTSRYFSRIYKYFTSRSGDIYISSSTSSFSATGLGFNEMEGFLLLNENNTNIGPDTSGKFIRSNGRADPLFNEYGSDGVSLTLPQISAHTHSVLSTTYSMDHLHMVNTSMYYFPWLNGQWHDLYPNAKPVATSSNSQGLPVDPYFIDNAEAKNESLSIGGDGTQELLRLNDAGSVDPAGKLSWTFNPVVNYLTCDTNFMRTKKFDLELSTSTNSTNTYVSIGDVKATPSTGYIIKKSGAYWARQDGSDMNVKVTWSTKQLDTNNRGTSLDVNQNAFLYTNYIFKNTMTIDRDIRVNFSNFVLEYRFSKAQSAGGNSLPSTTTMDLSLFLEVAHDISVTFNPNEEYELCYTPSPVGVSTTFTSWQVAPVVNDILITLYPQSVLRLFLRWGTGGTVKYGSPYPAGNQYECTIKMNDSVNPFVTLSEDVTTSSAGTQTIETSTKIDYYTHGISGTDVIDPKTHLTTINNNNLATHSHTFDSGTYSGSGVLGTDGAPHENRPPYKVMAFYTKKYDFKWRG